MLNLAPADYKTVLDNGSAVEMQITTTLADNILFDSPNVSN